MRNIFLFILVFLSSTLFSQDMMDQKIAVFSGGASGLVDIEESAISSLVEEELVATGEFRVIEQSTTVLPLSFRKRELSGISKFASNLWRSQADTLDPSVAVLFDNHFQQCFSTFFYKYMRKIISNGKLYLAMPPLYKLNFKNSSKYAYDEKEKDQILKANSSKTIPQITRYKGLGEMPAEQLKNTTMDVKKRKLIKISLNDGVKEERKTEKLFESLMGKKAEYRFQFIQENANFTKNIDI